MDAGLALFRSILDKPLAELTEEDISQLTREDCRKYLKEKGMRRPSWNKSQAIQQVISLKALLETSEDSGTGALRRILVSRPLVTPNSSDSIKESSADAKYIIKVDETAPCPQNDSPKSTPTGPLDCQLEVADNRAIASRSSGATDGSVGQMTIFCCGKVNVCDGVPADKAQAIVHLAASPIQPHVGVVISGTTPSSLPCHLQRTEKMSGQPKQCRGKGNYTNDHEGQSNREMLLQRYREKRKDRYVK